MEILSDINLKNDLSPQELLPKLTFFKRYFCKLN